MEENNEKIPVALPITQFLSDWETDNEKLIPTGLKELDELIGGFMLGELVIFGSMPEMGKKELLINMGLHISQNYPFMFIPLDYSLTAFKTQLLASISKVNIRNIVLNKLSVPEHVKIGNAIQTIENRHFYVAEYPLSSLEGLLDYCKKQIDKHGIKVIILDSLTSIAFCLRQDFNRYRDIGVKSEITSQLNRLAKEHNICIVLGAAQKDDYYSMGDEEELSFKNLPGEELMLDYADKIILSHHYNHFGIIVDQKGNVLVNKALLAVIKNSTGAIGKCLIETEMSDNKINEIEELPF